MASHSTCKTRENYVENSLSIKKLLYNYVNIYVFAIVQWGRGTWGLGGAWVIGWAMVLGGVYFQEILIF